uniref:LRR receptor-like serine/threonine-protein kinase n=1 Tax=Rhizophora mucronata TaxID=61149 RepID=A0A2P2MSZ2_RHIMU
MAMASRLLLLLLASLAAFCLASLVPGATVQPRLASNEEQALRDIAKTLGKTNWDFSVDPCGGELGWANPNPVEGQENAVKCNCSFPNDTSCHVVSIVLKAQNLPGTLPTDLDRFPYLQEIDLTRNYLSGTIPPQWGSMQLVNMYVHIIPCF